MNEKAADIAECLFAARRIDEENGESWIEEWSSLASRVEELGDESLASGHTISARESFNTSILYTGVMVWIVYTRLLKNFAFWKTKLSMSII